MIVEAGSGTSTPARKVKGAGAGASGIGASVRGSKRRKVEVEVEPEEEEVVEDAMEDDTRMDVEDGLTKPEGSDPNLPPKRQVISCKPRRSRLDDDKPPSNHR